MRARPAFLAGDLEGAAADFQRAAELGQDFVEPRLSLGALRGRQGRHREALRLCVQAVDLSAPRTRAAVPTADEGRVVLAAALDCCATELEALGRPGEARSFIEAGRRSGLALADRLRSLSQTLGAPRHPEPRGRGPAARKMR